MVRDSELLLRAEATRSRGEIHAFQGQFEIILISEIKAGRASAWLNERNSDVIQTTSSRLLHALSPSRFHTPARRIAVTPTLNPNPKEV